MKKLLRIVLIAAGAAFLADGAALLIFGNIDFGIIMTPIIGAVFVLCGIFFDALFDLTRRGIMRGIKYAIFACATAIFLFSLFLFVYGENDNVTYAEDAVIVLGCGLHGDSPTLPLRYRLDATLDYMSENPDAVVVVSGGMGFQETVTEASAMEKYLVENGANPNNIIKEEISSSTSENFELSKEILDGTFGGSDYTVCYITNGFHIFRAGVIARMNGLDAAHCHAGIPWYTIVPNYIRECAAVVKLILKSAI